MDTAPEDRSTNRRENVALYGHWICPFSTRVEFALHQRGIDHDLVDLPPVAVRGPDFVLPPEFVENSPRLEIPMVRIGAEHRADSIPVLEWLEARFDERPLLPADPDARHLARERMAWVDDRIFPAMVRIYYGIDPERIEEASRALAAELAALGAMVDATGWLAGEGPSLAEAVLLPLWVRLDGLRELGFTAEVPEAAAAYAARCRGLDGWAAVEWSPDQTAEFVGRFRAYRRKKRR
jgi:glutathione S-transferase